MIYYIFAMSFKEFDEAIEKKTRRKES